jgi:imidazolonepropionase-like amidohydrolase
MSAIRGAAALAIIALLSACASRAELVVKNVVVYDGLGDKPFLADVEIKNGRFSSIRDAGKAKGEAAVDGSGLFMTPGLWDMHAHIANDRDLNLDISEFPKAGVTAILDAGGFTEILLEQVEAVEAGDLSGPAVYFVGPTLNGAAFGDFQKVIESEDQARDAVAAAAAAGASAVKIHRAFKPELLPAVIRAAHHRGLRVTGHIPLGVTPLDACEAGMDGVEHVGSFLEALISTAPEGRASLTYALEYMLTEQSAPLYSCLKARGATVTPTLVVYPAVAKTRGDDVASSPAAQSFIADIGKIVGRLHKTGVTILAGTDTAGGDALPISPGVSLLEELEFLQDAGMAPTDVIKAATTNAARAAGAEGSRGAVAVGEAADFLLLDSDPGVDVGNFRKLRAVYQDGVRTR